MILNRIFARRLSYVPAFSFARRFKPPTNNIFKERIEKRVKEINESFKLQFKFYRHTYEKIRRRFFGQETEEEPFVDDLRHPETRQFIRIAIFMFGISICSQIIKRALEKLRAWKRTSDIGEEKALKMVEQGQVNKIILKHIGQANKIITQAEVHTANDTFIVNVGNPHTFKERIDRHNSKSGFKVSLLEERHDSLVGSSKKIDTVMIIVTEFMIMVLLALSIKRMLKGYDLMSMTTVNNTWKATTNIETRFSEVAGLNDAKMEIMEFVDFLKNPTKYKELGARIPKGALLSGPPGTGKTMLAKACAGEAGVPFISASGSEFVEVFVGVGAARVRDLFKAAKKKTPSIIFIDEIDAIGRKRQMARGGSDERSNTLNQLLVEMDGFGSHSDIIVLAATNRKQLLDSALTRPGRFDRTIQISLPDLQGRKEIFLTHLKPLKLSPERSIEEYAKRLATLTPGFSGADIYNICNEAAIVAARLGRQHISSHEFQMATERVIGGVEKKKSITEKERRVVAYHECGHAVVSWFLEGAHPLLKLTIIPRSKGALGFAQYLPPETQLQSKQELLDEICAILGGRCAEQYFFKSVTTGAQDDLQKVYKLARSLVVNYGMSDRLGLLSLKESNINKQYSEEVNELVDEEVTRISHECTQKTRRLVAEHAEKIKALAEKLLEKETLDSKDIRTILGQRPFPPKSNYKDYLEQVASE